ncbi:MAG: nitrogen regulation protein NR(II) [Gammaproteobacteria bacterium]
MLIKCETAGSIIALNISMTTSLSNVFSEFPNLKHAMEHKKILDNLTLAVFLLDDEICMSYVNPAAEELLGTGVRHVLNRPLTDFFQDIDGNFISHVQTSLKTGHPVSEREVCIKRLGGSEMTINCAITPMLNKGKKTECLLEIIQVDHLLRISREEHLLFESHATRNMLRGLAHEIKNPLGGLRGAAQLLAGELGDQDLCEYTDVIINEADRLRKLVDRMIGPNVAPVKKEINIHDVLEHIRHLAMAETPSGITFNTDYDPSIPSIKADRDLLVQAILNIVRNAVRAIDVDGEVTVKTRVLRQYTVGDTRHRLVVQISIIDNGSGIAEELQPQVFFPMVSGSANGTGLGLPISQNLINLHGGLIEFDSIPGHTEFRMLLPLNGADYFTKANQEVPN